MSTSQEPADGGYVLVRHDEETFSVWRRRDGWAEANNLGDAHWFSRSDMNAPAITWVGLTDLGELGYVGDIRKVDA